jgi:hypothetical protein
MPNAILDPTGRAPRPQPVKSLAPRGGDLRGARVGLLENGKQNAALFLAEVGELLTRQFGVAALVQRTKRNFAQPIDEALLADLAGSCDVVITGVGDCGSCSAAAVADGIALEGRGVPAAVICTEAFVASADAMAGIQGAPGYHYARTAHPVAVLTPEEVAERAAAVLPDLVSLLSSGRATSQVA